jgi:hypothetical protein
MKKYIYILGLFVIGMSSCKKDEVIGGTSVEDMSGEWWVQIDGEGSYYSLVTYNTSDNSASQMWLDASGFWAGAGEHVSAKVNVDLPNLAFSVTNAPNVGQYYDDAMTMTVEGGKVIKNGAIGPVSKQATDSIALTITFSDAPDDHYKLTGYHRTKFPGDDH